VNKLVLGILIACAAILCASCAEASTDTAISPSVSLTETEFVSPSSPFFTEAATTIPLPLPTPILTATSQLLSIDTPTTTITEAFASSMVAMHPYSDTLLYGPVGFYTPTFKFIETTVGPDLSRRLNQVTNPSQTFRAFTVCNPDLCHERIFVENLSTGQTFEIWFSGYMAWRPITHIHWLDDDVLLFSHPSQPSYGFRYAVDVREQEFLLVILVTSECFVYGKCD